MIVSGDKFFVGRLNVDDSNKELGRLLDAEIKHHALNYGFELGTEYSPWDLRYKLSKGYEYFDIKLSCSNSITISDKELRFASDLIETNEIYSIAEFNLDHTGYAVFKGTIKIIDIVNLDLLSISRYESVPYSAKTYYYKHVEIPQYLYKSEF